MARRGLGAGLLGSGRSGVLASLATRLIPSSGSMLFAVFVVAAAASCINVGKALQKEGTKRLPRLVLDARVLGTYARDPTWALGMALDVLGGLLMVLAISLAPVSLVQPVAAGGVAVLAVFSHFRLGERLDAREWAGVALAVVGTVGIGAVAEEEQQDAPPAAEMTKTRVVLGVALVAVMLAAPSRLSRGAAASKASIGGAGGATTGSAGPLNGSGGGGGGGGGKKIVGLVGVGQGIPHHLRHAHLAAHAPAGAQSRSAREVTAAGTPRALARIIITAARRPIARARRSPALAPASSSRSRRRR